MHLTPFAWHGTETEPVEVRIPVDSEHDPSDIDSATIRVQGQPLVTAAVEADPAGYAVVASFRLPAKRGAYRVAVEVEDTAGNEPIVVAAGRVHVDRRVQVADPPD
jgi:hypothetical protein